MSISRLILESVDNCFKTTTAELLKKELSFKYDKIKIIHFSAPPNNLTQHGNFINLLNKINDISNSDGRNLVITDRDIYGEIVYGPLYRKENPNWIWSLEYRYFKLTQNSMFILLEDSARNTLKRDDGKSFTTNIFKRQLEILKFRKAFRKSIIPFKHKIRVTNKSREELTNEIKSYLYDADMMRY